MIFDAFDDLVFSEIELDGETIPMASPFRKLQRIIMCVLTPRFLTMLYVMWGRI
jgi:hypothetical protein